VCTNGTKHPGYKLNGKMWLYDHSTHTATEITSGSYAACFSISDGPMYCCTDRDHRKVWWLIGKDSAPSELCYSTFDDPANIRRFPTVDVPEFRPSSSQTIDAGAKGMAYWNNYLWFPLPTAISMGNSRAYQTQFWRIPVF